MEKTLHQSALEQTLKNSHVSREAIQDAVISDTDFRGVRFSGVHFVRCLFTGSHVAEFDRCVFKECAFSNATLRARFDGCVFYRTTFSRTELSNCSVANSTLETSRFIDVWSPRALFANVSFTNCEMFKFDLVDAEFAGVTFALCHMAYCRLNRAGLAGAAFPETILAHVDVAGAYGLNTSGAACVHDVTE
jgi:uncharacterized protein YjbI with pentapeptide repeats